MAKRRTGKLSGYGSLAACLLGASLAGAGNPAPGGEPSGACRCLSLDRLAGLSWAELDQLYCRSEAGTIPHGFTAGRAIYCPDRKLSGARSRATRVLWHGKVFDACSGTLVNQWCGFRAITARVSYGPSWRDGQPAIIMDYAETSRVWADVRDEVREVAPGLYVGLMYLRQPCGPRLKMFFALEAGPACREAP